MGKPIELSEREIRQIEGLAALGRTQAEIALALGFSERTFRNKKAIDDAVFAAWERGKLKGVTSVSAVAFRNAMEGDQRAVEFYLGAFHGVTTKTGEVGNPADQANEQDAALLDPHDELLRRYDEIALRQAASAEPEAAPDLEPQPREHNPIDDDPSTASEADHAA